MCSRVGSHGQCPGHGSGGGVGCSGTVRPSVSPQGRIDA
jgi:hypothetical protein